MRNLLSRSPAFFLLFLSLFLSGARADTVYLKNGQQLEGLISRQDKDTVDLDVGFGIVGLKTAEIRQIDRSSPPEAAEIRKNWEKDRAARPPAKTRSDTEKSKDSRKWAAIIEDVDAQRIRAEKEHREKHEVEVIYVPVRMTGHYIYADAEFNNGIPTTVVVDTGAPQALLLTGETARKLGFYPEDLRCAYEIESFDGKHRVGQVMIKKIKLGNLEAEDIKADVLLDENRPLQRIIGGGLLGLGFLKKFDISIDQKNSRLIFKRRSEGLWRKRF